MAREAAMILEVKGLDTIARFEGGKNADHFFPRERHRRFVLDLRGFQFGCRIMLNPFSLFGEA
jgi:hypothetical protein